MTLLNNIKNSTFDPKNIAFTDVRVNVDPTDSSVYARIVDYSDEVIKVEANASGNNFLFLGDTYLPYGWKAKIDGKSTEVYKANYDFMGIVVPKGKHTVSFIYSPDSFYISKYIVLILSSLVVLGLILIIVLRKKASISQQ